MAGSDAPTLCDIACELGEGPTYDPATDTLFWFDIVGRKLFEMPFPDGPVTVHELPVMASALAIVDEGRQLLATETGLQLRDVASGALTMVREIEADSPKPAPTTRACIRAAPSGSARWAARQRKRPDPSTGISAASCGSSIRTSPFPMRSAFRRTAPLPISPKPPAISSTVSPATHRLACRSASRLSCSTIAVSRADRRRGMRRRGTVVERALGRGQARRLPPGRQPCDVLRPARHADLLPRLRRTAGGAGGGHVGVAEHGRTGAGGRSAGRPALPGWARFRGRFEPKALL